MIKLTENEIALVRHLLADDFIRDTHGLPNWPEDAMSWIDCVGDGFDGCAPGTMSSLYSKGVLCGGHSDESFAFTAAGAVVARFWCGSA